jgi:hypothetical protein
MTLNWKDLLFSWKDYLVWLWIEKICCFLQVIAFYNFFQYVQDFNICFIKCPEFLKKFWWLYKTDMQIEEYFFKYEKGE